MMDFSSGSRTSTSASTSQSSMTLLRCHRARRGHAALPRRRAEFGKKSWETRPSLKTRGPQRESADELTGRAQRIKLGFFIKGWKQTRQRVSQLTVRWSCRVPWGRLGSVLRADIRSAAHRLQRLRAEWHAALPDRRELWDRVAANWFEDTG